jgi:hypothetical protein
MEAIAEYPDGTLRTVSAHERKVPAYRKDANGERWEDTLFIEPVESEDWTFIFQVERDVPNGGFFRAIPLRDQLEW